MTPQETIITLCICGNAECQIPFGYCHCGCGDLAETIKSNRLKDGQVKGMPFRFKYRHRPNLTSFRSKEICICGQTDCSIPRGYCHCGCGEMVPIAKAGSIKKRTVRGFPVRYLPFHHFKRTYAEDAVPFKIDGVYCRLIPLTQDQWTIVNASRYDYLSTFTWCAVWNQDTKSFYAMRHATKDEPFPELSIRMHRVILGLDPKDERRGDHKNNVTLDNRDDNLRPSPVRDNCANSRKSKNNTSGYKGVSFHKHKQKFIARIMRDRKSYHLGEFATAIEAHKAYCEAAIRLHGEYARFE